MSFPTSTYRVQLHKGFPFSALRAILPYLHALGISHIYASPVTAAVKGSTHGYDVTDPLCINPEIGTREEWDDITAWLKERQMGWIQDIVPNHMAFSMENPWLYDVLERGPFSEFFTYFDIIPQAAGHDAGDKPPLAFTAERIMVPFLGKPVEACVAAGELQLAFGSNGFYFQYDDQRYPVAVSSYSWICSVLAGLYQPLLAWAEKTASFGYLPWESWRFFKEQHLADIAKHERLQQVISASVKAINADAVLLTELLGYQPYRLCSWEASFQTMNYRRFFAVNALICLRIEDKAVFRNWHPLLLSLYREGLIQGFRIDHIDGLCDPGAYLEQLRQETGPEAYIVTEKILQEKEQTIPEWPVQGTSGYEFLSFANQLLTDQEGRQQLLDWYRKNILDTDYKDLVFEKKSAFLHSHLKGEMKNLLRWLNELPLVRQAELPEMEWRDALSALMSAFPVYRIYPRGLPLSETDREYMETAFIRARERTATPALPLLRTLFLGELPENQRAGALKFIRRWAQFTGPLAAKGTEDTVFYVDHFLLSLNEVGDAPGNTPVTAAHFHALMQQRQRLQPHSMNATSTHDTKRGEDSRMRISLLTAHAAEWLSLVNGWLQDGGDAGKKTGAAMVPLKNHRYMIFQALLGALPEDGRISLDFRKRFDAYLLKALREGKVHTTWEFPDLDYEKAVFDFVKRILDPSGNFLPAFLPFARKLMTEAADLSLSQTLLKLTAPGIPDIYQGAETWDLSLVDPDNRLPVDFEKRQAMLKGLGDGDEAVVSKTLATSAPSGAAKLQLILKLLNFRREHPRIFSSGHYIPVTGTSRHLGYLRAAPGEQTSTDNEAILVLITLPGEDVPGEIKWPDVYTGRWRNGLTGAEVTIRSGDFVADLLDGAYVGFWIFHGIQ